MTAEHKQTASMPTQEEAAAPPPSPIREEGREEARKETAVPEAEAVEVVACEMAEPKEQPVQEAPPLAAPPSVQSGPLEKCFRALAVLGPVSLLLLVLAHVWPEFWQARQGTALYCPAELGVIEIFRQTQTSGDWLTPTAGALMAWPGFNAWLGLWAAFLPHELGIVLPLAGISAGLLALWAVWAFACAVGFGRQAALVAGLVLLASPAFLPLLHQISPAGLAAALLMLSLLCLCKGWQAQRSWLLLPLGFALAALAGLTGGLFHLLVPLLTSMLFLFWRCTFRRAQAPDALTGFMLLLLLLGGWLGTVILFGNAQGYLPTLSELLLQWRGLDLSAWLALLLVVGLALLPWSLLLVCVSWGRVLASSIRDLNASRHERAGAAFAWLAAFTGLLTIFLVPQNQLPSAGLALACLAAPLLGKALLRLSPLGSRFLYLILALLLLHAGMAILAAGFETSLDWMDRLLSLGISADNRAFLLGLRGLPLIGGGCILLAILLARFTRCSAPGGALLACVLGIVVLAQPVMLTLLPSLAAQPKARLSTLAPAVPVAQPAPEAVAPETDTKTSPKAAPDAATEATPQPAPVAVPEVAPDIAPKIEPEVAPAPEAAAPPSAMSDQAEEGAAPETASEPEPVQAEPTEQAQPETLSEANPVQTPQEATAATTADASPEENAPGELAPTENSPAAAAAEEQPDSNGQETAAPQQAVPQQADWRDSLL